VGSLKEEHKPLDFVIPNQFIDRTRHRIDTFFGDGVVAHVGFGDPLCDEMARVVLGACKVADVPREARGTYVCMEGPQFHSTKAESNIYRSWGAGCDWHDQPARSQARARSEICYVTIAMVTDYDCCIRITMR